MGSSRCCRPGTSWGATGRPTYSRRSTNCAVTVTGHRTSWRRYHSTRRGPTPFSGCQKRARQWECTYRNLQVTGEERIKESNRDGTPRVAQQKTRFDSVDVRQIHRSGRSASAYVMASLLLEAFIT